MAGALTSGILAATTASAIFIGAAILCVVWFIADPPVRRLLDKRIPDLRVTIEQKVWDNFRHQALILEMRVKIKNRKNKRKVLTGFELHQHGGGIPANFDTAIVREVQRRLQNHPSLRNTTIIEARATVTGWIVYPLPMQQDPGEPVFRFSVTDELNVEYVARQR
jgi:hypothetical protein